MMPWLTPAGPGEAEFVEKRSRFIGRIWPAADESEALEYLAQMRRQHYDARHNVYAYIIKDGAVRYSDDGEPGGTAGQPILAVLQRRELYNVCCVVTRYFGGILLGAGGLTRAYSKAAVLACEAAGLARVCRWTCLTIPCPYSLFERIRQETAVYGGAIEDVEYGAEATMHLCLPEEQTDLFVQRVTELAAGRLQPKIVGQVCRALAI